MVRSDIYYDPFNFEIQQDPYPVFKRLRDESPLYRVEDHDLWILTRDEDVRKVVHDWKTFSNREGVDIDKTDSLLSPGNMNEKDGEEHDKYRRLVQSWFGPKQIRQNLVDPIRTETQRLVREFHERGGGDFVQEVAWQLPTFVITQMFDTPEMDRGVLLKYMTPVFARIPNDPLPPPEAMRAGANISQWCQDIIRERRKQNLEGRTDILSMLVHSELDGVPLSDQQIEGIIGHLIVASSGTTQDLISNAVWLLATHPEERDILIDNPEAIPGAIEECLRYEAVVQSGTRISNSEVEFYGTRIPAGSQIVNMWGSANRDDRRWREPDRFDVMRNPHDHFGGEGTIHGTHLSFADGIHLCLGRPIARLEAKLVLEEMLTVMPRYELSQPPQRAVSHVARGFEHVYVTPGN